jgi:2-dehydro-3-deoxygluconokinase
MHNGESYYFQNLHSMPVRRFCREAVEFATVASCQKHIIEHDYNLISVQEVSNLVNGDASGRFSR